MNTIWTAEAEEASQTSLNGALGPNLVADFVWIMRA